jgi:hypothetical protein
MEGLERKVTQHFDTCNSLEDATGLIVISKLLNSDQHYQRAKNILIQHRDCLAVDQAERIGARATYEIMAARLTDLRLAKCSRCRGYSNPCSSCRTFY